MYYDITAIPGRKSKGDGEKGTTSYWYHHHDNFKL
jgi:hypothetical protein